MVLTSFYCRYDKPDFKDNLNDSKKMKQNLWSDHQ